MIAAATPTKAKASKKATAAAAPAPVPVPIIIALGRIDTTKRALCDGSYGIASVKALDTTSASWCVDLVGKLPPNAVIQLTCEGTSNNASAIVASRDETGFKIGCLYMNRVDAKGFINILVHATTPTSGDPS